jgi:phosphoribosyl-AMP cyclohydrolase
MDSLPLDFKKLGSLDWQNLDVMPVAVQDHQSHEVLMVAYVNQEALEESFKRNVAVFWSTSRNKLWVKGESSGDTLILKEVRVNCYGNSLLFIVELLGKGMCHTKDKRNNSRFGCYYRQLNKEHLTTYVQSLPYTGN